MLLIRNTQQSNTQGNIYKGKENDCMVLYKEFVVREKMKIGELKTFNIVTYTTKVAKPTLLFQLYVCVGVCVCV